MEYVWVVRFAEGDEEVLIFDNPTTAYDACVDYIYSWIEDKKVLDECIEEIRQRFLEDSDEFWCEEVCWCWIQKIIKKLN